MLKEIINLSFPRFFRFFASRSVDSDDGTVVVAEEMGKVVGLATLTNFFVEGKKYGCILWLAVHPTNRRQGIASTLVSDGVTYLKNRGAVAIFASAQRSNKASLGTFAKIGFKKKGAADLWKLFGWRVFRFYGGIWYAPGEVVLMQL